MVAKKLRTQSNRQLGKNKILEKLSNSKTIPTRNLINIESVKINLKGEKFKTNKAEKFKDNNNSNNNDLLDFLSVSVEDNESDGYIPLHKREYNSESQRYTTYISKYLELAFKYGIMVALICMNFIALSLSLNCNVGEEFFKRIASAIFAFFFGFIYILVNYYTYRVMSKGQICKMNKEKLFPFTV
jgi:hypothetical protein